jgi:hypothetical protein
VAASGPAGVGNASTITIPYTPLGYNPTYACWEVSATNNLVNATLTPAQNASLDHPIFMVDNYTASQLPPVISVGPGLDNPGADYFATLDTANKRLWITVNRLAASPVNLVVPMTYTVTLSSGSNGSVIANNSLTVAAGGSVSFTATPATGYQVSQWLVNGSAVQTGGDTYALNNVAANTAVQVTFIPLAPVVGGASSVTGTQGVAFTYQIIASDNPTTFTAIGLPPNLIPDPTTGLISGTPTAAGTFSATISAINTGGTGSASLNVLILAPYSIWESQVFTSAQLAKPAISGDTAIPAGDGIPNLMKYALNLNPWTNGAPALPVPSITTTSGDNYLTLTYTQVKSAVDLTYAVQVSKDFQTWNSGQGYTTAPNVTNNPDGITQTVTVQSTAPVTSANNPKQYIRLQVTGP